MKSLFRPHSRSRQFTLALVLTLASFSDSHAQAQETIKVETELVNIKAVVTDRGGRRIGGLKKEDFEVYEDGAKQEITHFATEEQPLRLVLLFDASISMEEVLPVVKEEAARLIANLRSQDEVSIVTFASGVNLLASWINKTEAAAEIEKLHAESHPDPLPATIARPGYNVGDGNTNMYEALKYVFDNVQGHDERVAVIMFSDGVDTGAGRSIVKIKERAETLGKEVKWLAEESWALVYPIRFKTKQWIGDTPQPAWRPMRTINIGSPPVNPSIKLLTQIAGTTGGVVFEFTTQQDLMAAIQKTLTDLRSQYSIAYRPPQSKDKNAFHRIKVRVKRPDVAVRTRDGYRRSK